MLKKMCLLGMVVGHVILLLPMTVAAQQSSKREASTKAASKNGNQTAKRNLSTAKEFMEALNNNDQEKANQYVCKDQQSRMLQRLLEQPGMAPKGKEVLGHKSPGLTDIICQNENSEISCTFIKPVFSTTGDFFSGGNTMKFKSFEPGDKKTKLTFDMSKGKICGYYMNELDK